ncbi:MAG: hypothetical protein DRP74_08910, partial [Candidatus Omnitrophota bacterium]
HNTTQEVNLNPPGSLPFSVTWISLTEVGQFDDGGVAWDVHVVGTLAYVADGTDGLEIINVIDPINPIETGQFVDGGDARGVHVVGTLAYVADGTDGLEIINVTDPTNPTEVGQFDDGGDARGVHVMGTLAYVADGTDGLEIINVIDPTNPIEIGQFVDGGYAWDVHVEGTLAYVADGTDGVEIINVTDPINLTKVGFFYDGGNAQSIHIISTLAYVADETDGLEIIEWFSSLGPPWVGDLPKIGQFNDGEPSYAVQVVGTLAFVAGGDGLEIIDVTDPTNPTEIGQFYDGGEAWDVQVVGTLAYVADRGDGLEIIDVTDPTNPTEIGQFDYGGDARGVQVIGTLVFIADFVQGLEIIDVTDPTNPIEVGQFYDGGNAHGLHVVGTLAYIADRFDGLEIIDVTDPTNPTEIGQFDDGGKTRAVQVIGTLAFVADYGEGLEIINVTDPTSPTLVGVSERCIFGVHVVGVFAYLASEWDGLEIVYITSQQYRNAILIKSPLNQTYLSPYIDIYLEETELFGDTIWYRIFNKSNDTWVDDFNVTYTGIHSRELMTGEYVLYVWGNDTAGNIKEKPNTVHFSISTNIYLPTRLIFNSSHDIYPTLAISPSNQYFMAWSSDRTGNYEIWYRNSSDGRFWSDVRQLTDDSDVDYCPSLAFDSHDNLYIFWTSNRTGNTDIWYKKSSDLGNTWSNATQFTFDPAADRQPCIAIDSNDVLHVFWASWRTGGSTYYKNSTDGGQSWSSPIEISQMVHRPTADYDEFNHGFLVSHLPGIPEDVWILNISYNIISSNAKRVTIDSSRDINPFVILDSNNNTLVFWQSNRTGETQIWCKLSENLTLSWTDPLKISKIDGHDAWAAFDSDNNLYLTFESEYSNNYIRFKGTATGTGNRVHYRDIAHPNYNVTPGDVLHYDIYFPASSETFQGGIDLIYADGTSQIENLRDSGVVDQYGVYVHPACDLEHYAKGNWYHREIPIPPEITTISAVQMAFEADSGTTEYYLRNIQIKNGNTVKLSIYTNESSYIFPDDTIDPGNAGYINVINEVNSDRDIWYVLIPNATGDSDNDGLIGLEEYVYN